MSFVIWEGFSFDPIRGGRVERELSAESPQDYRHLGDYLTQMEVQNTDDSYRCRESGFCLGKPLSNN